VDRLRLTSSQGFYNLILKETSGLTTMRIATALLIRLNYKKNTQRGINMNVVGKRTKRQAVQPEGISKKNPDPQNDGDIK
jgi:hypothetical protein